MTNRQAMETLATVRFMMSSGLMKITKENAAFIAQVIEAFDQGISAIDKLEKENNDYVNKQQKKEG